MDRTIEQTPRLEIVQPQNTLIQLKYSYVLQAVLFLGFIKIKRVHNSIYWLESLTTNFCQMRKSINSCYPFVISVI